MILVTIFLLCFAALQGEWSFYSRSDQYEVDSTDSVVPGEAMGRLVFYSHTDRILLDIGLSLSDEV